MMCYQILPLPLIIPCKAAQLLSSFYREENKSSGERKLGQHYLVVQRRSQTGHKPLAKAPAPPCQPKDRREAPIAMQTNVTCLPSSSVPWNLLVSKHSGANLKVGAVFTWVDLARRSLLPSNPVKAGLSTDGHSCQCFLWP